MFLMLNYFIILTQIIASFLDLYQMNLKDLNYQQISLFLYINLHIIINQYLVFIFNIFNYFIK